MRPIAISSFSWHLLFRTNKDILFVCQGRDTWENVAFFFWLAKDECFSFNQQCLQLCFFFKRHFSEETEPRDGEPLINGNPFVGPKGWWLIVEMMSNICQYYLEGGYIYNIYI